MGVLMVVVVAILIVLFIMLIATNYQKAAYKNRPPEVDVIQQLQVTVKEKKAIEQQMGDVLVPRHVLQYLICFESMDGETKWLQVPQDEYEKIETDSAGVLTFITGRFIAFE